MTPDQLFALAGFVGPDDLADNAGRNWQMAVELRSKKSVHDWIQEGGKEGQYLRGSTARNEQGLRLIGRLHETDRKAWLELDALK